MTRPYLDTELIFVGCLRDWIPTLPDQTLDRYRILGEEKGGEIVLGDLTGDELFVLCDAEIAGRYLDQNRVAR